MANRWVNSGNHGWLYFLGSKTYADGDCSEQIKRCLLLGRKVMTNLESILKSRDITLPTKVCLVKAMYGIFSSHVWMWELDYKESWVLNNPCFQTVVLKTLESPLGSKEIQPDHPKGDQSWVFFGRTDVEAETPILWSPDAKNWLIIKDPDAGKDWRWKEKGTTEDEVGGITNSMDMNLWVWVNSGSWWRTGRPGMLQSMGSQRVRHDWAIELILNWTKL